VETWHKIDHLPHATCEIQHACDNDLALMEILPKQQLQKSHPTGQNETGYVNFSHLARFGIAAVVWAQWPKTYSLNAVLKSGWIITGQLGINT
jgi:hypothetical protein